MLRAIVAIPSFEEQILPFFQENLKMSPKELYDILEKHNIVLDKEAIREINIILMKRSAFERGTLRRLFKVSEYIFTLCSLISLKIVELKEYMKDVEIRLQELIKEERLTKEQVIIYLAWYILYLYGKYEKVEVEVRIVYLL